MKAKIYVKLVVALSVASLLSACTKDSGQRVKRYEESAPGEFKIEIIKEAPTEGQSTISHAELPVLSEPITPIDYPEGLLAAEMALPFVPPFPPAPLFISDTDDDHHHENSRPRRRERCTESEGCLAPYKGAETFAPSGEPQPNVERCGAAPQNLEATFTGSGIDNAGGMFNVSATACIDTTNGAVSDLIAIDTYVTSGDSITIKAEKVALIPDQEICASITDQQLRFTVAGGTGRFLGARGEGKFDFATNDTTCNSEVQPAHVWFKGELRYGDALNDDD